ncbi:phage shock protein operon transcriptional activator [Marinibactrum halimedae]|uniref:Phage shock protein operon transcriptional activator n=1 Tax=Marinibactrum halimedae TaxID=1444977 RepID=A0AA37T6D0_9GAMM|nr:phage shock protein operon transcriptional activator [Marinibactrum halimedae]MCD9458003.1 phage shock protein operon transcriptional activator [Marinibactrum halimedae]GLS27629.1 phage shock protein operon transcriptional activator [Marinibactrum halimedae]
MSKQHEEMLGNSLLMNQALAHLSRAAPIDRPVLILGERGTGKELAAERLHFLSNRWGGPLVKVNCAALSDELLESELFGHEPGAFTGATRVHQGRFERANGGTLFLDELGTMSGRVQEKLLRLIEYGEFERLGGQKVLSVDVRVVAATNADLKAQAKKGRFREDLLDRLSFDVVHLPPLRLRSEDVVDLAQHFALKMCRELGWDYFPGFSDMAQTQLRHYDWPGNVRELKNVIERSLYRAETPLEPIETIILDPFLSPFESILQRDAVDDRPNDSVPNSVEKNDCEKNGEEFDLRGKPEASEVIPLTEIRKNNTLSGLIEASLGGVISAQQLQSYLSGNSLNEAVDVSERLLVKRALELSQNHQGRAAELLGLTYHQLRGQLRKHAKFFQTLS